MAEPEIARRCPSCGASIRVHASFCPQCGKPLRNESDEIVDAMDAPVQAPAPEETQPLRGRSEGATLNESTFKNKATAERKEPGRNTRAQSARDRIQRATGAARHVIEDDMLHGVQKIRKISNVVLDEASYDPSLRFLLVAALLFLLFVLIVFFSKMIG